MLMIDSQGFPGAVAMSTAQPPPFAPRSMRLARRISRIARQRLQPWSRGRIPQQPRFMHPANGCPGIAAQIQDRP